MSANDHLAEAPAPVLLEVASTLLKLTSFAAAAGDIDLADRCVRRAVDLIERAHFDSRHPRRF
jgi:hypothetical protein